MRSGFTRFALSASLLIASAAWSGCSSSSPVERIADVRGSNRGEIRAAKVYSPALHEEIRFNVYIPAGYDDAVGRRYPTIYLLHGRGDSMSAWLTIKPDLDAMIAAQKIPPVIAIMPDAPFSRRASYYIDSHFADHTEVGGASTGRFVESAFTADLVSAIDATYRTRARRNARVVAGYSMGGYGAMRFALAHPNLFGAAIVLSPAVYHPLPPRDSSTREFGAFGTGEVLFDEHVYQANNYPAILPRFHARDIPIAMYIGVGDGEVTGPDPSNVGHGLDQEARALYDEVRQIPSITAEFRLVHGGHNWDTWRPTFIEGAQFVFRHLESSR